MTTMEKTTNQMNQIKTTEDKHQEILNLNMTVSDSNNNLTNIITIKEYIKFLKRELIQDRDRGQIAEGYAEYIDTMYDALLDNKKQVFDENYEIILKGVHQHIEDKDSLRATINNLDRLYEIVFN